MSTTAGKAKSVLVQVKLSSFSQVAYPFLVQALPISLWSLDVQPCLRRFAYGAEAVVLRPARVNQRLKKSLICLSFPMSSQGFFASFRIPA